MGNYFFRINRDIDSKLVVNFKDFIDNIKDLDAEIYLIFDTEGGDLFQAKKFVETMRDSKLKYISVGYKKIDSAGVHIFLSSHIRYAEDGATCLIHRLIKISNKISDTDFFNIEKEYFEKIAKVMNKTLSDVYEMADKNTILKMSDISNFNFFVGSI